MRLIDADALIEKIHIHQKITKEQAVGEIRDDDVRLYIALHIAEEFIKTIPSAEPERKNVIEIPETGIGDLSDGYHTFNGLYEQRMILFAALVKAYKDRAWKSYRHEDGEWCFGGGWFIVGIDTPEGSYTYHYENKYWDMFDCADLPRGKHWDGHTEADAETRLLSLELERKKGHWIKHRDDWYSCSLCEAGVGQRYRFCPNCGADMRGGEECTKAQ